MIARQQGFTFIEMVVAITVAAIVVGFMALFLVTPVDAYLAQERRTELADSANNARRMLANDIRNAVPDSLRAMTIGTNRALEMLQVADVARYRPQGTGGAPTEELAFGVPGVQQFSLLSPFTKLTTNTNLCGYLVIGPGNPYAFTNVATPAGTCFQLSNVNAVTQEQPVVMQAPATFPGAGSATRTVFYVAQPVSYVCNLTAGTLRRFEGYAITANQATHGTEAQLLAQSPRSSLVARDVTDCVFQYSTTAQHGPLARLTITFTRNGETLQVFDQVQVENAL